MDKDLESVAIGSPSLLAINAETGALPTSLGEMENTCHLFIRKQEDKGLDGENGFARIFDILDSTGTRIYRGVERTPKDLVKQKGQKVFTVSILDLKELEVFRVIGRLGEKYKVFQGHHFWGGCEPRIHHHNRDIYPIHFVKRGNPKSNLRKSKNDRFTEILYIVEDRLENNSGCCGMCKLTDEGVRRLSQNNLAFEAKVFLPDKTTCVGRMGPEWSAADNIACDKNKLRGCVGIQFPGQTDLRIKAILLGAPFFLNPRLFAR